MTPPFRAPIQGFPAALLGLLGLKNGGQNPGYLLDGLSPTLDLFQFYINGNIQTKGSDVLTFPVGQSIQASAFYTVPRGKMWFVRAATFGFPNAGSVPYSFTSMIVRNSISQENKLTRALTPPTGIRPATGEFFNVGVENFWMDSLDQIAVANTGLATTTAYALSFSLQFAEFQK